MKCFYISLNSYLSNRDAQMDRRILNSQNIAKDFGNAIND